MAGCFASPGLPCSYSVQIDSSFSNDEIAIIEASMSSWTSLSADAPTFDFQVIPAFSEYHLRQVPWGVIVIQRDTLFDIRSKEGAASDTVGLTETSTVLAHIEYGSINLDPKTIGPTVLIPNEADLQAAYPSYTESDYFQIVAHETGHALGLRHTGEGTVMCKDLGCAAPKPTCADLSQYCSLRPGLKCDCKE